MALVLSLVAMPAITMAQTSQFQADSDPADDGDAWVVQHDLAGPRVGATFAPDGTVRSQFGWHFEHQAAPGTRGPWFIVENLLLFGGLENNAFVPNETVIFGLRTPGGFEFGVGPSVTLGGARGLNTGVVAAIGQSFQVGGIRVPLNLAVAAERNGDARVSIVTGWAIRKGASSSNGRRSRSL
jgi:hypothetical protein